jgi:hypothetical protein
MWVALQQEAIDSKKVDIRVMPITQKNLFSWLITLAGKNVVMSRCFAELSLACNAPSSTCIIPWISINLALGVAMDCGYHVIQSRSSLLCITLSKRYCLHQPLLKVCFIHI